LTAVIAHFKPSIKHEKGHISTSNIELGFELIEFQRFYESVFLQEFIRKRRQYIKDVGLKSIFHYETNWRKI
jgi:hypothetical protein